MPRRAARTNTSRECDAVRCPCASRAALERTQEEQHARGDRREHERVRARLLRPPHQERARREEQPRDEGDPALEELVARARRGAQQASIDATTDGKRERPLRRPARSVHGSSDDVVEPVVAVDRIDELLADEPLAVNDSSTQSEGVPSRMRPSASATPLTTSRSRVTEFARTRATRPDPATFGSVVGASAVSPIRAGYRPRRAGTPASRLRHAPHQHAPRGRGRGHPFVASRLDDDPARRGTAGTGMSSLGGETADLDLWLAVPH